MIQVHRSLVRAVLRRLVRKGVGSECPVVSLRADRSGLRARLHNPEVFAEFHQAGSFTPETVTLPWEALADLDGKGDGIITLESTGPRNARARWEDAVTQVRTYDVPEVRSRSAFPVAPAAMAPAGTGLAKALADASQSAAREAVRYATTHVQLRGRAGEVVATNGRELLLQAGFAFPFADDLLIPSTAVFGCKELLSGGDVAIGADKDFVTLRTGGSTFHFRIGKEGRFPCAEQVLPAPSTIATRWRIAAEDAMFLVKSLARLPGADDENAPVTVDLSDRAVVRARARDQVQPTEVLLAKSEVGGKAVRFNVNRHLLLRALFLGFTEVGVVDADTPLLAQDAKRKFVFMPLDKNEAIAPTADARPIVPSEDVEQPVATARTVRRRRSLAPTEPAVIPSNGAQDANGVGRTAQTTPRNDTAAAHTSRSVLEEAAELKCVLRDAYIRVQRLIVGLQRQKKQSQVVRATLASLRHLQHLHAE